MSKNFKSVKNSVKNDSKTGTNTATKIQTKFVKVYNIVKLGKTINKHSCFSNSHKTMHTSLA